MTKNTARAFLFLAVDVKTYRDEPDRHCDARTW
jgi:hypothetical protein